MSRAYRIVCAAVLAAIMLVLSYAPALAAETVHSSGSLVELAEELDGHIVTVRGEVIGDALRADVSHVWLNVLSGGAGVGLYVDRDIARQVETLGAYRVLGDEVEATGRFHFACEQHGGELDVHVVRLRVTRPGGPVPDEPQWWRAVAGLVLVGISAAVVLVRRARRATGA